MAFSQPLVLTNLAVGYRNAENTRAPLTADLALYLQHLLVPGPKPVPSRLNLYLTGAYGRKALFRFSPLDETETMAAFQALHAQHPAEALTLWVETDEHLSKASL